MERLTWHFNVCAMSYTQVTPWANHVVWPVWPSNISVSLEPFGYYWKRFLFRWIRQPIKCCKLSSSAVRWKNICKSHIIRAPSNRQHNADNNQTALRWQWNHPIRTFIKLPFICRHFLEQCYLFSSTRHRCLCFVSLRWFYSFRMHEYFIDRFIVIASRNFERAFMCAAIRLARWQRQMLGRSVVYRKDF